MPSIELAQGEYLIWSSPRSFVSKISPRQAMGILLIGFYLLMSTIVFCAMVGWPGLVATMVTFAAIVLFVRWNRRRVVFFMTNRHLIDAGILFKQKIPLVSIQGCERFVQEVYTRYGVERVTTDQLLLLTAGQTTKFGPVMDFDGVWDLIHHGVLGKTINLEALPSLDGGTAPAEKRNDFLLLLSTKTDGDEYGPLFIGPTKIIRFTERLPALLERILLTVAAAQNTPEEMEQHMQQLVRHPQAGHCTILERDLTAGSVNDNTLKLTAAERVLEMELRPVDVTRTSAFVRQWRPAHPMR